MAQKLSRNCQGPKQRLLKTCKCLNKLASEEEDRGWEKGKGSSGEQVLILQLGEGACGILFNSTESYGGLPGAMNSPMTPGFGYEANASSASSVPPLHHFIGMKILTRKHIFRRMYPAYLQGL